MWGVGPAAPGLGIPGVAKALKASEMLRPGLADGAQPGTGLWPEALLPVGESLWA